MSCVNDKMTCIQDVNAAGFKAVSSEMCSNAAAVVIIMLQRPNCPVSEFFTE